LSRREMGGSVGRCAVHSPGPVSHSLEGLWPPPIPVTRWHRPGGSSMKDGPSTEEVVRVRHFAEHYTRKTARASPPEPGVTGAVLQGLARHGAELGRPLCPCRFYPDKREEVQRRPWLCACDDMKRFKYCHCLLFVRPDGLPITEHLPEGHPGRAAWGVVADPSSGSGREPGRSISSGPGCRTGG